MKPAIGKKVYIIYEDTIGLESVGYVGKESFIIEEWSDKLEDAIEYNFEDYGTTWFTNLAKAKKKLLEDYKEIDVPLKVVQVKDDYWVLQEKQRR